MGMHLNYELRLPGSTTADDVARVVGKLREIALTLRFKTVSPIYQQALLPSGPEDQLMDLFQMAVRIAARAEIEEGVAFVGAQATATGFVIHPGVRCEGAAVGFLHRVDQTDRREEWFWYWRCKTQYASVISDQHLVACHTGLVRFLDEAAALGVDVVVRDEGHYWETRDEARLLAEVRAMNQLVARFAGAFSDAIGQNAQSPLFAHPDFERLEMGE